MNIDIVRCLYPIYRMLMVESEQLQNDISKTLDQYLPQVAYELQLNKHNEIIWIEHFKNGEFITHHTELKQKNIKDLRLK